MNRAILFLLISSLFICFSAKANIHPKIKQELDQKIQNLFPNAHVGLVIQHLEKNQLIYAKKPNQYFFPASTIKLLTSYAALNYLGSEYTYQTTLQFDPKKINSAGRLKGDMILAFNGDPSLTDEKLEQLLLSLKEHGVKQIQGKIYIEGQGYALPYAPPGATWDVWSYYPPVSSIILNENTVSVKLQPSTQLYEPCGVNFVQPENYTLTHQITTVSEKEAEQSCSLDVTVDTNNAIHLSGCWPINQPDTMMTISLASPEKMAEQKIKTLLKKHAIQYPNQAVYFTHADASSKAKLNTMASVSSLPLPSLIKTMLHDSNNLYADSLHKKLGQTYFDKGGYAQGVMAQQAILTKLAVPLERNQQFDGSGASRYNLLTPNQLVTLLTKVYQDKKNYPILLQALPVAGTSGTLKNRFQEKSTRICQNKIHAKTGSLRYISALAGYLSVSPEQQYAFALMIQGEPNKMKKIKQKEDVLMAEIYQLLAENLKK